MLRRITLLFLCVFMVCACASFHCSKEVQWLLEDARLHEMQHTSRDAMLAERFHDIADCLDSGKVERRQLISDLVFITSAKASHEGLDSDWDRMWIARYQRVLERLWKIYEQRYRRNKWNGQQLRR